MKYRIISKSLRTLDSVYGGAMKDNWDNVLDRLFQLQSDNITGLIPIIIITKEAFPGLGD